MQISKGPHRVKHLRLHLDKSRGANVGFRGIRQQASQFGQRAGHDHLHCGPLGTRICLLGQILILSIRSIFPRLTIRNMLLDLDLSCVNKQIVGLAEKQMIW